MSSALLSGVYHRDPRRRPRTARVQRVPRIPDEHPRGVACLLGDGIDGLEAHVLAAGAGQLPEAVLREYRGWSEEEWAAAVERLRARGWVGEDGSLTEAGRAAREVREQRTDELSMGPWRQLGEKGCARLLQLLDEPVRLVVEGGGVPFPNPVGLPAPSAVIRRLGGG